jgi:hypothetical protein
MDRMAMRLLGDAPVRLACAGLLVLVMFGWVGGFSSNVYADPIASATGSGRAPASAVSSLAAAPTASPGRASAAAPTDPLVFGDVGTTCTVDAKTVFAQAVHNTDTVAHTAGMGAVGSDNPNSGPVTFAPSVTALVAPGASTTLTLTQSFHQPYALIGDFNDGVPIGTTVPWLTCGPTQSFTIEAISGRDTGPTAVGCGSRYTLEVIAAPAHGAITPAGPYARYRSTTGFVGTDHFDVACTRYINNPYAVRVTVDVTAVPVTTLPASTVATAPKTAHPPATPAAPTATPILAKTGAALGIAVTLGLGLVAAGVIALLLSRSRKNDRQLP